MRWKTSLNSSIWCRFEISWPLPKATAWTSSVVVVKFSVYPGINRPSWLNLMCLCTVKMHTVAIYNRRHVQLHHFFNSASTALSLSLSLFTTTAATTNSQIWSSTEILQWSMVRRITLSRTMVYSSENYFVYDKALFPSAIHLQPEEMTHLHFLSKEAELQSYRKPVKLRCKQRYDSKRYDNFVKYSAFLLRTHFILLPDELRVICLETGVVLHLSELMHWWMKLKEAK